MAATSMKRQSARRERLRDEYYSLTADKRGDEREGAYVTRRLWEQRRKDALLILIACVVLAVFISLVPWRL